MYIENTPEIGATTSITLGTSNGTIGLTSNEKSLRIEFLMSYYSRYKYCGNILAACAFNIINSHMRVTYGTIFPRVVELYYPQSEMRHIIFSAPYLWNLEVQEFDNKKIAWLLAVPISDAEYKFSQSHGSDALEDILQNMGADVFDINRKSVI